MARNAGDEPAPGPDGTPTPRTHMRLLPSDDLPREPGPVEVEAMTGLAADSWTIAPGDHLWHVAAVSVERALGRTPTDGETAAYWRSLIDRNADRLVVAGEPDLVLPGQRFDLPPVAAPDHR